jgi:hypothetical protein
VLIAAGGCSGPSTTVTVDTGDVLSASYLGTGVHLSPYDMPLTADDWSMITQRLGFMQPKFARVMINGDWYVSSFDGNGKPVYDFDSAKMRGLYRILDYCQRNGITVVFGEWGRPRELTATSPQWAEMIARCLSHLYGKGYTCIRYDTLVNEPNGWWSGIADAGDDYGVFFTRWRTGVLNLYAELSRQGLLSRVSVAGPDATGADHWVDWTASELASEVGIYDVHRYAVLADVEQGAFEGQMRARRQAIDAIDPLGRDKAFTLNEAGMIYGHVNPDSQSLIDTHLYGVWMADMVIQSIRAGMAGQIEWDLDDAQHTGGGYGSYNLKKWGLWSSYGGRDGYPASDRDPRPWFYVWSLMSRYFPQGAQTLRTTSSTSLDGIRSTAMRRENGSGYDLTVVLVNDSDTARSVTLVVPNARGTCTANQYRYRDGYRPVDADLMPVPESTHALDLAAGIALSLEPRSVLLLTTMGGGSPLDLADGARP